MSDRVHPFAMVFAELAPEAFPAIATELEATKTPRDDRDAFVLTAAAGRVLRELVAPNAPPDRIEQLIALLHHGFRYWANGQTTVAVSDEMLRSALDAPAPQGHDTPSLYVQLPERRVWAQVESSPQHQPLDGCFVAISGPTIDALAVFGLHAARQAFAVIPACGPADPAVLARDAQHPDDTPLFASRMPGGEAAGLASLTTVAELLLLVQRLVAIAPNSGEP